MLTVLRKKHQIDKSLYQQVKLKEKSELLKENWNLAINLSSF